MVVELTEAQARAVAAFLAAHLGDLSAEIAATDNPAYRRELVEHRDLLREALAVLSRAPEAAAVEPGGGVPA